MALQPASKRLVTEAALSSTIDVSVPLAVTAALAEDGTIAQAAADAAGPAVDAHLQGLDVVTGERLRAAAAPTYDPSWAELTLKRNLISIPATPYEHDEYVHPSVIHAPDGWNGYEYWMAVTPLSGDGNEKQENPCIYASADGDTWVEPAGIVNPIVPPPTVPAGAFNADPDLLLVDETLYCFYTRNDNYNAGQYAGYLITSTDGVTWGTPEVVYSYQLTERKMLSPSIVHLDGTWHLWAMDQVAGEVVYMQATSPTGPWTEPQDCSLAPELPAGRDVWHLQVRHYDDTFYMLLNDTAEGISGDSGNLIFLSSFDGTHWRRASAPLANRITPWGRSFYRSTFIPKFAGGELYFDTWANIFGNWGAPLGLVRRLVRGRIDFNPESAMGAGARHRESLSTAMYGTPPYLAADDFEDNGPLTTTPTGQDWEILSGAPVAANGLVTVPAPAVAVIDSGSSDVWVELSITSWPSSGNHAMVVFRAVDDDNYWAFGWSSGLHIRCIYNGYAGGGGHFPNVTTAHNPYIGTLQDTPIRIAIRVKGNQITRYINGYQLGDILTIPTVSNQSVLHPDATKHGIRLGATNTIGDVLIRNA